MSNSTKIVTIQVPFYKGELRVIAEEAAAGNQTIQQFMQEAVREGIAEYKKNKTLPPAIDRIQ